jgi:multicomponent Na+:H+ antiporter subunit C
MSVLVALVVGLLFACGAWLLMQRRLTRIIIGLGLLGHGANLLLVTAGGNRGRPPIIDERGSVGVADPVPQALVLTAIVISFGVTAFLLALGYRSWQITADDMVEDDIEDRAVARRASQDGPEGPVDDGDPTTDQLGREGTA